METGKIIQDSSKSAFSLNIGKYEPNWTLGIAVHDLEASIALFENYLSECHNLVKAV